MAKQSYGECTGKCKICTINLWESAGNKPVIFPCNLENCPYEDPDKQNRHLGFNLFSLTGSGLG